MITFESGEYWQRHTWDRFTAATRVPEPVRLELLRQEELTLGCIEKIVARSRIHPIRLIDLGCGTGRMSKLIAHRFGGRVHLTLLDFNPRTLAIARQNLSQFDTVEFVLAPFAELEASVTDTFDIVVCMDILHHVRDIDALLCRIYSILGTGGSIIANVFIPDKYIEWDAVKHGKLKSLRRRVLGWLAERVYPWCPSRVKTIVRRSGIGRIAPVQASYMLQILSRKFANLTTDVGYYLWFHARKS